MNVKDILDQQALGKSMCSTLTLINAKGSSSHSREITGGGVLLHLEDVVTSLEMVNMWVKTILIFLF